MNRRAEHLLVGLRPGWRAASSGGASLPPLQVAQQRIRKLDDAREEACLRAELAGDVRALLGRASGEAQREAGRLAEQLVQLRLERGRLQREEVVLREKVGCPGQAGRAREMSHVLLSPQRSTSGRGIQLLGAHHTPLLLTLLACLCCRPLQAGYLQRVNAELHELLEANDSEALQQAGQLESERRGALQHCRQLQEVVAGLQARLEQGQLGARDLAASVDLTAQLQVCQGHADERCARLAG
jgi:hypothetical protein